MDFLIRTVDYTAAGREIVREREVSTDAIGIGRASTNEIHLPDLAVEQEHLRIEPQQTGQLKLEAVGTLGFAVDGRKTTSAIIDPAKGAELRVGGYLLQFAVEDARVAIVIREADEDEGEAKDRLRGFSLAAALPGKRPMAWATLAVVLVAFLAVPVWSHLTRVPAKADIDGEGAVVMDASWSTGALSSVHHGLEDNCEACHVEPFVAVRDETCLECHAEIADHAADDRMARGMEPASGGDAILWNVAHAFGKPGPGACTDCHTEHEGEGRMEPTSQAFCADCHDTLDTRLTDTSLGNASDFGKNHPQFKALVLPDRLAAEPVRVSLASSPVDWNGLRFPHDMHLSTSNGVAQMARRLGKEQGFGAPLECSDCHTPTADGVRFLPVNMEENCESCHSLVYDKVGSTYRTLSHGNVEQIEADLLAADRSPRQPVSTGRRRPGQFAEGGIYYGNFSRVSPAVLRSTAMAEDGLCGECHLPGDRAQGALAVAKVTQRDRYFIHGWFDHADHVQEDCASCHAAEQSASASDLLLPDLGSCRDCHEGEASKTAEVPSSCAMCHSYHPRDGAAAAPPRIAGNIP